MKLPVDLTEETPFVCVDLRNFETRHLAPGLGGVVSVLQVFRR